MKWHGWLGAAILLAGEGWLYAGVDFVATWFTPLMWTGYILLVDAVVARRAGRSWLTTRRREFPFLVLISVLTWLLFEVYNFKLKNWAYIGLPELWQRDIGFFWSFATITPALFQTADLLHTFAGPRGGGKAAEQTSALHPGAAAPRLSVPTSALLVTLGLALVAIPPAMPDWLAPYAFAPVWIGFVPLLEPLLLRAGQPSLLREWQAGRRGVIARWLAAGFICGLAWEMWNIQALGQGGAGWEYTMPPLIHNLIFGLHYGRMPVAGLLGFAPFAMECFAMYYWLRHALGLDRWFAH